MALVPLQIGNAHHQIVVENEKTAAREDTVRESRRVACTGLIEQVVIDAD